MSALVERSECDNELDRNATSEECGKYLIPKELPDLTDADTTSSIPLPSENTSTPQDEPAKRMPRSIPSLTLQSADTQVLQQWTGRVEEVNPDCFVAVLSDKANKASMEEVELDLEDVSRSDLDLVKPGAIFYWTIGYENYSFGPRKKFSKIRFRRLVVSGSESRSSNCLSDLFNEKETD